MNSIDSAASSSSQPVASMISASATRVNVIEAGWVNPLQNVRVEHGGLPNLPKDWVFAGSP